jgi:hypothetical protein
MAYGLTPDIRQRQLHDEDMTCGNQPANIRLINRRFNDPAPINDLDNINYKTSFKPKNVKESGFSFSVDKYQSYQFMSSQRA